jgi:hypothetical protein
MAALGNRTQRALRLESSMGVVEYRSTLCRQFVNQTGSKYAWMLMPWRFTRLLGRPSSTAVLDPFDSSRRTVPWRFTPELCTIGIESLSLGGEGGDRNTDADRSRVFWYVTLTPSESRSPACLASRLTAWARRIYAQVLGAVLCKQLPLWVEQCQARQLA